MDWGTIFSFLGTDVPTQALIWTILALGVFISYKVLNIADLSVDTLFPFAGIISLTLINLGVEPLLALLLSVLCGMAVGYLNAALHIYLKINPLLAGIIIMIALYTPNVVISKGNVSIDSGNYSVFTKLNLLFDNLTAVKIVVLALSVVAIMLLMYWFFGTELGLALRASGKNGQMSKAQGINTGRMYILGMILSAALISLAGALYAQMNKHTHPTAGQGAIVIGLTILFLGEVCFGNKSFKISLISVVVGALIYWLILDVIIEIPNFNTSYLNLVKAGFITLVVCLNEVKKKMKRKKLLQDAKININKDLEAEQGGVTL